MKNAYEKILKEIKQGKAVLVQVVGDEKRDNRYRLVTARNCFYDMSDTNEDDDGFIQSCFVGKYMGFGVGSSYPKNSEQLIERMKDYDAACFLRITKIQVLE